MKPRILIVDDSLTVRKDLEQAFAEAGFAPVLCANLTAARQAFGHDSFALIVLDVLLPDGDGIDWLKELRGDPATANIPILLLSTEGEVWDRVRGLATGASDYVGKPYSRRYVIDRARELIGPAASSPGPRPSPLVLVIEDSLTFREELRSVLESRGYMVRAAETGEDGLRLAAQLRPDAVVVDGNLPGIDGATVVHRLRSDATLRYTPCVLLTASQEKGFELRSLEAGADIYMLKQEGTDILLARLETIIQSAGTVLEIEKPLFGPKRILAVDDSPMFLKELTAALQHEEYEVVSAQSGEEALQLLAVQPADCILLDLVLPGLSGDEVCRRIKNTPGLREIPVLILTAKRGQEAVLSSLKAGADDYVPKSDNFEVLKGRVRAQLRRRQYEAENRRIQKAAAALRKNEAMLRALFEFAPDAIVAIDQDGLIVRANSQTENLFGYKKTELLGQSVELLVPERLREEHRSHRQRFFSQPKTRMLDLSLDLSGRRKNGSEFPVDIVLGPVQTDEGVLALAIVRDVSERRRAEAELKAKSEEVRETSRQVWQAAKLATVGELAASIAHELNNPLATVSLRVESLLDQFSEADPAWRALKVVEQETERMSGLVSNLLQFSRLGVNQISTVDVREEIDKTLELVDHHLRKCRVAVTREYAADLPTIYADRLKLRQLFLNLTVNAADAMPDGGSLTIRASLESRAERRPAVALEFSDTGVGIAPEHMARVMEPFFTTKPEGKGTGLGLAICRRVVQEHDGTIDLISQAGQGTTVRIVLPVANGQNKKQLEAD